MKTTCIYKIQSKSAPTKIYIGSAAWFQNRKWRHLNELKLNKHKNKKLQNQVNKYGIDDLDISILELVENIQNLIEREQFWMDKINPWFNILPRANSRLGRKHSEETKRKISEGNKGKIITLEQRQVLRESKTGVKWTKEQKEKFIAARKGVKRPPFTKEWLKNLSIAQKGNTNNIKGWITRRKNALLKKEVQDVA